VALSSPGTDGRVVLEISRLHKSFGAQRVLDDVSLTVRERETVCILGPSGSGKSTLLRCVNWLEVPESGTITLSGSRVGWNESRTKPMGEAALARMRTRMGMVFQHFALWPHMTVLQNVMEAPLRVQRRPRAEVRGEAEALLAKVGLADKRAAYPARLSGGQKQRVGIARALAMRPEPLLFDEPTSALDPELVGEVLAVMEDLRHEGMTMLIVTHEMAFAREAANRIILLDHGKIVEEDTPERFFTAPATSRARQFLARYV
jgi:polar amino acid transport system ATP-binding protein